jgi:hypothetical protein
MFNYINFSDNEYIDEILMYLTKLEINHHLHPADVFLLLEKIQVIGSGILATDIQGKRIQRLLQKQSVRQYWQANGKFYNNSFQELVNDLYISYNKITYIPLL